MSGAPGRTRTDNIQLRRLALYPVELRSERLLVGPSPVDVFGDKTPLTDRVLDRRNFRRARPVRVERHELPSALERRGEKDRELPYFGHCGNPPRLDLRVEVAQTFYQSLDSSGMVFSNSVVGKPSHDISHKNSICLKNHRVGWLPSQTA